MHGVASPLTRYSNCRHLPRQGVSGLSQHLLETAVAEADECFISFAGSSWTEGGDGKNICLSVGDGLV